MRNRFILSSYSLNDRIPKDISLIYKCPTFHFFADSSCSFDWQSERITIVIDGYILPRYDSNIRIKSQSQEEFVFGLYRKYQTNLIYKIKGVFNLIIQFKEHVHYFNDRQGINKALIYRNPKEWIITNDLSSVKEALKLTPDIKQVLKYFLLNNYSRGKTFFSELNSCIPATHITIQKSPSIKQYWNKNELLELDYRPLSIVQISEIFKSIIKESVPKSEVNNLGVTLTGGMDSRLILSVLLSSGKSISTMSYGHSESQDVVYARNISNTLDLPYQNHHFDPTNNPENYQSLSKSIISKGNGLINLHRAHRLYAYQNYSKKLEECVLYTGHMGGEIIRNFYFDGLIITPFLSSWVRDSQQNKRKHLIKKHLKSSFINSEIIDNETKGLYDELVELYPPENRSEVMFKLTHDYLIPIHHSQDIQLALLYFKSVIPFFLDDDILDLLYATRNTSFYRNRPIHFSKFKLDTPMLYCTIINHLTPVLAQIPFAKKGNYSPTEYIKLGKYHLGLKRAIRYISAKRQFENNFNYSKWFSEYIRSEANDLNNSPLLMSIINQKEYNDTLEFSQHKLSEGYWRKYSNTIFIKSVLDLYS